jgi:hypothetical protein
LGFARARTWRSCGVIALDKQAMFHEHSGRLRWHRSRLEAATFHMCWPRTRVYLYSPDYGMWKVDTATGGRSLSQHRRTYCTHGHVWTNNEFQSLSSLAALQFAAFQKESGFWDQGWWCREPFAPSRKSKRASETGFDPVLPQASIVWDARCGLTPSGTRLVG